MRRYELTAEEWNRIERLLPSKKEGRGRPLLDNRIMLNGMLWIARSGAQWRELPQCYGKWQAVYARFRKWTEQGVLERVYRELAADADMENLSIDSTTVKVHQSANGGKKGLKKQ